jgi:GNAT superfamily N-acetyltransferase
MFEVDAKKQRIYCENLCMLSKLFLDHKTLYYETEPFLFYILTEVDNLGCHLVGYFSKEKESLKGHNLACILVLPPHQKKGYGKFLITFSYELTIIEGKQGGPEEPLSDLGFQSYFTWWTQRLTDLLSKYEGEEITLNDITSMTGMTKDDILRTLVQSII